MEKIAADTSSGRDITLLWITSISENKLEQPTHKFHIRSAERDGKFKFEVHMSVWRGESELSDGNSTHATHLQHASSPVPLGIGVTATKQSKLSQIIA